MMAKLTPEEKTALYMESVVLDLQAGKPTSIKRSMAKCDLCIASRVNGHMDCKNCSLMKTQKIRYACEEHRFWTISLEVSHSPQKSNNIPNVLAIMVYLHGFGGGD